MINKCVMRIKPINSALKFLVHDFITLCDGENFCGKAVRLIYENIIS